MVLGLPSHRYNAGRTLAVFRVHDSGVFVHVFAAQFLAVLWTFVLHKNGAVGVLFDRAGSAQILQVAEPALVAFHAGAVDLA